jgi:hypothetical protein
MLQWDELNNTVSRKHDFRVFYDPESSGSPDRPWVLAIRELGQDGVHTLVFLHAYPADADAKEAAERWKGPPPQ